MNISTLLLFHKCLSVILFRVGMTITHDALDLTIQSPPRAPSRHGTSLYRDPLLVASGDLFKLAHFRSPPPRCLYLVAIEVCMAGASRWYASHWNAFLLLIETLKNI